MAFKKTKLALLVALALQQLSAPAFGQTQAPEKPAADNTASTPKTDADQLPEISVSTGRPNDDFAPGTTTTGAKSPLLLRDIPQSITVVNRAVLDSQGATSLAQALRNVPRSCLGRNRLFCVIDLHTGLFQKDQQRCCVHIISAIPAPDMRRHICRQI